MEGVQSALWLNKFVNFTKMVGNKIVDGAKIAAEKTKEGALYVAEKSKPVKDKIKEGASYLAEKTKPATDKIKEGASYVGTQMKSAYIDVKCKITGEPPSQPVIQPQEDQPPQPDFSEVQNMNDNQDQNAQLLNQPFPNQQQPIYTENLDNQNVNEGNNPGNYQNF